MKILVIYHAECPDGFAAAYVAWKALNKSGEDTVEFCPGIYQQPPPPFEDGTVIVIVDFSYPKDVLAQMAQRAKSIVVLDHHKTAEAALSGADIVGVHIKFDMSKSGAVLAWEHFYPGVQVPILLQYVQDRDLWQWKLPESKMINAGLWRGTPRDFKAWDDVVMNPSTSLSKLAAKGEAITVADSFAIETACREPARMIIDGHTVPAVNSGMLQSEIGHHLLEKHPDAPFVAVWFMDGKNKFNYSLRARTGGFDVSQVAKVFGGGGHAAAAGFRFRELLTTLG